MRKQIKRILLALALTGALVAYTQPAFAAAPATEQPGGYPTTDKKKEQEKAEQKKKAEEKKKGDPCAKEEEAVAKAQAEADGAKDKVDASQRAISGGKLSDKELKAAKEHQRNVVAAKQTADAKLADVKNKLRECRKKHKEWVGAADKGPKKL